MKYFPSIDKYFDRFQLLCYIQYDMSRGDIALLAACLLLAWTLNPLFARSRLALQSARLPSLLCSTISPLWWSTFGTILVFGRTHVAWELAEVRLPFPRNGKWKIRTASKPPKRRRITWNANVMYRAFIDLPASRSIITLSVQSALMVPLHTSSSHPQLILVQYTTSKRVFCFGLESAQYIALRPYTLTI